ncbi:DUF6653 family protein [Terasakiella sp. A23]|uniref:DUF6653 family protein n=1 Tax=Terasakiella sp. FCG-A23 TaxID=3080561 RepID=UPI0029550F57|nr:DUF6653 family protein [Terasakiella sp. A23]MDV7341416.1 DUF6653 family protein [Terasakiella sp. A23]
MYKLSEKIMTMDGASWARHANPWSVYTRFTTLPLLCVVVWSRWWLGWDALYPLALVVFWIWLNPRLFNPPKSTDNWASKGVMGEQLFLNRKTLALPKGHTQTAHNLVMVSVVGVFIMMWGLYRFDLVFTICGLIIAMAGKIWFVDRMVMLYEDVQAQSSDPGDH